MNTMHRRGSAVLLVVALSGCLINTVATSARPTAAFTATVNGRTVIVDASESSGSGSDLTYHWDFNGEAGSTGVSASHTFSTEGDKTITLIVSENGVHSGPAVKTVSVFTRNGDGENTAPVAGFSVRIDGFTVTVDGSASRDADNDTLTYSWAFDGEAQDESASPTAEHTFDTAGDKTISLAVNDGQVDSATVEKTVTVPGSGGSYAEALTAIAQAMPSHRCTTCHRTSNDSTRLKFGTGSESDIEEGIAAYLEEYSDNVDLVKNKPTGEVSHTGGRPFEDEPLRTQWETLVDGVASDVADSASNLIEEDCEDQTVGEVPKGWGVNKHYSEYEGDEAQEHSSIIRVVDTVSHSGSKALYVSGANDSKRYIYRDLEGFTEGSERLYVRFYLRSSEYLGNRADQSVNHNHFLAISNGDVYNEKEIRIGEMKGALGVNESVSDALVPKYEYWWGKIATPRMNADTWYCVESAFLNDGARSELRVWVDGELVTDISEPTDFHSNVPAKWLNGRFGRVNIGWASWGTYANEVYFDDIVVATERVGCLD
jgi:chitodextrinase